MSRENPSFTQINQQKQNGVTDPTILIERSNRSIQTAHLTDKVIDGRRWAGWGEKNDETNEYEWYRPVSEADISDQAQEAFAESLSESYEHKNHNEVSISKIGNSALAALGIEKPKVRLNEVDIKAAEVRIEAILQSNNGETIQKYIASLGDTAHDIRVAIDLNNKDSEARDRLKIYIDQIIDRLGNQGILPDRVQRNAENNLKSPLHSKFGHPDKMMSRDYASRLVVAMLDGSFDEAHSAHSPYDINAPQDDRADGQHRRAAEQVLRLIGEQNNSTHVEQSRNVKDILIRMHEKLISIEDSSNRAIYILDAIENALHYPVVQEHEVASRANDLIAKLETTQASLMDLKRNLMQASESDGTLSDIISDTHIRTAHFDNILTSPLMKHLYRIRSVGGFDSMELDQLRSYVRRESDELRSQLMRTRQFALDLSSNK